MKKWYVVLSVILLINILGLLLIFDVWELSIFWGGIKPQEVSLSAELKAEIEEAWPHKEEYVFDWEDTAKYYGTYNDAAVFFDAGGQRLAAIGRKTIAGREFTWVSSFSILVYKDGEFLELEDAYEKGMLTEKDIKQISKRHDAWVSEKLEGRLP